MSFTMYITCPDRPDLKSLAGPFRFCSTKCYKAFCDWYENTHSNKHEFNLESEEELKVSAPFTCDNCYSYHK